MKDAIFIESTPKNTVISQFVFKVNDSKLSDVEKLGLQIERVASIITDRYNINASGHEIKLGTVDNDFVLNRFRLMISFIS